MLDEYKSLVRSSRKVSVGHAAGPDARIDRGSLPLFAVWGRIAALLRWAKKLGSQEVRMFALQRLDILSGQSLNPEDMAKRVAQACNAQRAGNDARVVNVVFFTGLGREVRPEKSSADALGGAVESVLAFHREVEKLLGSMTLPRPVTPMVRLEDGETGMAWIDESWGPLSLQLRATPQKRTRVRLLCGDIARRLLGHRYGIPRYALVLTHPDQHPVIMRAAEAFYQNSRR